MIHLEVKNRKIEMESYSGDATLTDLAEQTESFRLSKSLKTKNCKGCGGCCNQPIPVLGFDLGTLSQYFGMDIVELVKTHMALPEPPDLDSRRKGIDELVSRHGFSKCEAAIFYEYNQSEPIILGRRGDGTCIFLEEGLCSIYSHRPYICGLYLCNMGEKLSILQEMVVRQGTWHAYTLLGWISSEELAVQNPFLKSTTYDGIFLREFEYNFNTALDELFFYF